MRSLSQVACLIPLFVTTHRQDVSICHVFLSISVLWSQLCLHAVLASPSWHCKGGTSLLVAWECSRCASYQYGSVYMELEQFFASEHPCVCFWQNTRMERVDKIKCWEKMQHTNLYASDFDPTAPKQMDNIVQSMPFTNSTRKYWILTSSYKIGFSTFTDTSCLKKAQETKKK